MDQHWLTILIVVLIIGIVFDGVRRMRNARRDSIKMALRPVPKSTTDESEDNAGYGSEFPNGGARVSDRHIDPERIKQVRNKYNFGSDMSAWKDKVAEKIAEHTGIGNNPEESSDKPSSRIEPSFESDPLMAPKTKNIDNTVSASTEDDNFQNSVHDSNNDSTGELDDDQHEYLVTEDTHKVDSAHRSEHNPVQEHTQQKAFGPDVVEELEEEASEKTAREPVQASLNLEDSVPMLMDSLEDASDVLENTLVEESEENSNDKIKAKESKPIVSVGTHIAPERDDAENELHTHSANKPRYESKYTDHTSDQAAKIEAPEEVLVIHVKAAKNEFFYGNDLLELILDNGLRYGAMDIFHRHAGEDGEGPVLFSMANMVKPGIFDLHSFEEFSTVGLSFFLALPTETGNNIEAFESMLATAKDMAQRLDGELNDEQRSVLTGQTIEHYRERIRDFARRQQLEKNKL